MSTDCPNRFPLSPVPRSDRSHAGVFAAWQSSRYAMSGADSGALRHLEARLKETDKSQHVTRVSIAACGPEHRLESEECVEANYILDEILCRMKQTRPRMEAYSPPLQGGVAARIKDSQNARRRGGCVILRTILIEARAAHRLKPFNKERFAGINKEASQYDQPPRLRLQRKGAIFLMRSHPALQSLQRRGLGFPATCSSRKRMRCSRYSIVSRRRNSAIR